MTENTSGINLALLMIPDDSSLATASYAERMAALAPKKPAKTRIVVASTNPVKVDATKAAFHKMFAVGMDIVFNSVNGISGVSDQPKSQAETRQGAENRARSVFSTYTDTLYTVGIEGGIEDGPDGMRSFAWVAVYDGDQMSCAQTAVFYLPQQVAQLVRAGKELGQADDIVFGKSNSKQANGAVGLLTHDAITRADYYEQAVIMALIPFENKELTWPSPAPETHRYRFEPLDMAVLSAPVEIDVRIEQVDKHQARVSRVFEDGSLSNQSEHILVPSSDLKPFPEDRKPAYETVFGKDGAISINRKALTDPSVMRHLPVKVIDAIKRYRQLTNAGLKEAKDAVEYASFYLIADKTLATLPGGRTTQERDELLAKVKNLLDAIDKPYYAWLGADENNNEAESKAYTSAGFEALAHAALYFEIYVDADIAAPAFAKKKVAETESVQQNAITAFQDALMQAQASASSPAHSIAHQGHMSTLLAAATMLGHVFPGLAGLPGPSEQISDEDLRKLRMTHAACETDLKMVRGQISMKNEQVQNLDNRLRRAEDLIVKLQILEQTKNPLDRLEQYFRTVESHIKMINGAIADLRGVEEETAVKSKAFSTLLDGIYTIERLLPSMYSHNTHTVEAYSQTREELIKTRDQLSEMMLDRNRAQLAAVNAMLDKEELQAQTVPLHERGRIKSWTLGWANDHMIEDMRNDGWNTVFEQYVQIDSEKSNHVIRFERLEAFPEPEREEDEAQAAAEAAVPDEKPELMPIAMHETLFGVPEPVISHDIIIGVPEREEFPITNAILKFGKEAVREAMNQKAIGDGVDAAVSFAQTNATDMKLAEVLLLAPRGQDEDDQDDEF